MHQGNWKCSSCGGAITELPFQPRSEAGLTCRTCWSKKNGGSGGSAASSSAGGDSFGDTMTDMPAAPDLAGEMPADFPEDADLASEPMPSDDGFDATPIAPGEKPKIAGNWTCAGCGGAITSLPFSPRDTSNLKCIDCFKRSKN